MVRRRVIPTLLVRGAGLVKTCGFSKPRYVGDPINAVRIFNEKEVDELILLDILASKERRPPNFSLIEAVASEAFMPVCYGGGVRSVEDARRLLALGLEKVALNTVLFEDLGLVRELASQFGSQCVVASVDVKRTFLGKYEVFSHAGARPGESDPIRWATRVVAAGAGELLVTSVDREGSMRGFDLDLLRKFDGKIDVPVIAAGGAGSVDHMEEVFRQTRIRALGVGSRFVFEGRHRAVLINYLEKDEVARLQSV